MKLWGGRFDKEMDAEAGGFNASIHVDGRMFREDIAGSIAHAKMLGKQGIIPEEDAKAIVAGLQSILADAEAGKIAFLPEHEDIHMNIEALLTERIGQVGKKLHTARSRNDQVALDIRMYLKKEIRAVMGLLLSLEEALIQKAKDHTGTVMPAYTHLQRAQPSTYAHYLMAYAQMIRRDIGRLSDCFKRMDEMPLGSGALAGTTYPLDREFVAGELGFSRITENSLDSVSDRDFALELLSALSILMMHMSRFCEEIVLWCSWEFRFLELDDAYSTGSSIMPQKKNPDVAELIRGKTGRVYGALIGLLTVMKALPLAYNKDMQEDKEGVFDAVDTVKGCLRVLIPMFEALTVKKEAMARAAERGFINATDCADYLVKKGLPFRDAYMAVGKLINHCVDAGETLLTLPLASYRDVCPLFAEDVYEALSLSACVEGRSVPGGPAKEAVVEQIRAVERFVAETRETGL